MLQQQGPDKSDTKVIGYASSKFKAAEKNYSVHEKELIAVMLAVHQWNCFLEGSKFTVYTDHSSLVWLNKLENPSRRQSRWVDTLQGHDFEVMYIKGLSNPADALTRVPWQQLYPDQSTGIFEFKMVDKLGQEIDINSLSIRSLRVALIDSIVNVKVTSDKLKDWQEATRRALANAWKQPLIYKELAESYVKDPNYKDVNWINKHNITFKDGIYYHDNKVAIPDVRSVKRHVLQEHHDSMLGGHLGVRKTVEKMSRLFWWPGLYQEVYDHVKTCPACQVTNYRNKRPAGQTIDYQPALSPWEVVHVEFAGPFKHHSPGGYNRICIFTDAFTKLTVYVKCKTSLTSEGLAQLYLDNIWKVYGRPGKLVSDTEPIMCAEAYLKVHEKLGTKVRHIAAYNAKANGAAEVMVKQLKGMLRAYEVQGLKWWKVSQCM